VGTQALADELGKDGAGVVVSQVVPNPFSTAKPITREFRDAIAQGGNKVQANFSSLEGYLAARLVAEGLRRAGGRSGRDGLISGLEAIGDTSFEGYAISLGPKDHVASSFVELSMLTGDGKVRT
jgi:ABC-type branched-subunit amino acid transport system substrate-binding protein